MEEQVYRCEACGSVMVYDVVSKKLKCPNCNTEIEIANDKDSIVEHKLTLEARRTLKPEEKPTTTMECTGCGAVIEVGKNITAVECPYCGSQYVLSQRQLDSIIPDGIIPFAIDQNHVNEIFRKWVNGRWLAPNALKNLYQNDKIQGVYLPYWTFNAKAKADYTAMGGKHRTVTYKDKDGNTQTKTETDWYHTRGHVDKFFDDVLVKAVKSDKAFLLESVEPYNTKELASYSPEYISGYISECYSVDLDTAHHQAVADMNSQLRNMARQDVLRRYDDVKDIHLRADFSNESYKHIIVPVYTTSYNYKGKNYNVVINGQNGKIKGDYPKSFVKIGIIIAAILAVIIGIYFYSEGGSKTDSGKAVTDTQYAYLEESNMRYEDDYLKEAEMIYENTYLENEDIVL